MKYMLTTLVLALGICHGAKARITYELAEKGAMAKLEIKVVDQDGHIVPDAKIWGGFTSGSRLNDYVLVNGVTDTNGIYIAQGKCNEFLRFEVRKDGYYRSNIKINFLQSKADPVVVDGKWQPYGETRTVVLKRVQKPQEMLGPDCPPQRKIKIYDKWLGFDLEKGDFLPPMGVGAEADMLVRFRLNGHMPDDWSIMMDVSFTNNPYAGACRLKKDGWSDMKSSYYADTNAVYQTDFTFKYCHEKGVYPYSDKLNQDEYMIFRTRTKVDRDGKLVSARYGKLYGPWDFEDAGGSQIYKVFLNAKDNDVNLEDMWTVETARKYRREN